MTRQSVLTYLLNDNIRMQVPQCVLDSDITGKLTHRISLIYVSVRFNDGLTHNAYYL